MKAIINSMLLAAALTVAWGCSSGDDSTGSESRTTFAAAAAPRWTVEMHSNQERPQWEPPTPSLYENNMIVMLRLQEELVPFSTDDDLMAVFVSDEYRALSRRSGKGNAIYFVLNIYGNSGSDPELLSLCYYSGGLKQEFWRRGENGFLDELNIGTESDFVLDLMTGTTIYDRQTVFIVKPKAKSGIAIDEINDRVGVFVDGECRGVGKPGSAFNVYHQKYESEAELRYYSESQRGIYTSKEPLTLDTGYQTIDFEF